MDDNDEQGTTYSLPPGAGTDVPLTDEERCFRILARPSLSEMHEKHVTWIRSFTDQGKTYNSMLNIPFMKKHGWTWVEFLYAKKAAREGQ